MQTSWPCVAVLLAFVWTDPSAAQTAPPGSNQARISASVDLLSRKFKTDGVADLHCDVVDARFQNCTVSNVSPLHAGLEAAALAIAPTITVKPNPDGTWPITQHLRFEMAGDDPVTLPLLLRAQPSPPEIEQRRPAGAIAKTRVAVFCGLAGKGHPLDGRFYNCSAGPIISPKPSPEALKAALDLIKDMSVDPALYQDVPAPLLALIVIDWPEKPQPGG